MNIKIATGGNYIHSHDKFHVNGGETTITTRGGGYLVWLKLDEPVEVEAGSSITVIAAGGHRDCRPIYLSPWESAKIKMTRSGTPGMESRVESRSHR